VRREAGDVEQRLDLRRVELERGAVDPRCPCEHVCALGQPVVHRGDSRARARPRRGRGAAALFVSSASISPSPPLDRVGRELLTTLCLMSHKDKTTVAYDTRLMMSPVTLRYAA
jgi:hypothetical protein